MVDLEAVFRRLGVAFYRLKIWTFGASWAPDPSGAPVPPRYPSLLERLSLRLVSVWGRRSWRGPSSLFEHGYPFAEMPARPKPPQRASNEPPVEAVDPPDLDGGEEQWAIPFDWLTEPTTIEAAESVNMVEDRPFGGQETRWRSLTRRARSSDQVWWFVSPPETWRAQAGRMGVALVREGKVIGHVVTLMN